MGAGSGIKRIINITHMLIKMFIEKMWKGGLERGQEHSSKRQGRKP